MNAFHETYREHNFIGEPYKRNVINQLRNRLRLLGHDGLLRMPYIYIYILVWFDINISWGGANLVSNLRVIYSRPFALSPALSIRASTGGGKPDAQIVMPTVTTIFVISFVAHPLLKYSAVSILFPRRTCYFTTNGISLPCNINLSEDTKSTISVRHAVRNTRGTRSRRFNEIGGLPGDNGHGIKRGVISFVS